MKPSISILLIHFFIMFHNVESNPVKQKPQACPWGCADKLSTDKINVHFIPHSHDDVGWLQTFSGYYYGSGDFKSYDTAGVQYILNSTIPALKSNSDRTYIQVETAFFWKWWAHQSDETKQDVVDLVNSGQLEIINGAWAMNDEAAAHYHSIIDQFTWGFRILDETVGECGTPKIGWQIDPFGHSKEHASLVKQMGFEGLVIGRIDYRDKEERTKQKKLDFLWKSSANLENSEIFTTMFPNFYTYEKGFCYDVTCKDSIAEDNLETKVADFAMILDKYAEYYQTLNILIPMGQDFSYQKAEQNFQYTDLLISGFKNHENYNVFYSTPSCYIQAVKDAVEANDITLTTKTDDFFPYASDSHAYWTGYFTSRPTSKRYERLGNNILQGVKQLATFSRIDGKEYDQAIIYLRTAMGVLQHHDAITGTEKQAVANDYARMLHEAITTAEKPVGAIIGSFLRKDDKIDVDLKLSSCLLANVSVCDNSQKERFVVAVQNPLSRSVTHYVRLPVDGINYKITGPDGEEQFDLLDTISTFQYLQLNVAPKELVFAAKNIPPLGVKIYYVEKTFDAEVSSPYTEFDNDNNGVFGDDINGFTLNTTTGQLKSIKINNKELTVRQEFMYYNGSIGSISSKGYRASGAYIFKPEQNEAKPLSSSIATFKSVTGKIVDEVIQQVNDEVTQIIRVYKNTDDAYVEFDWLIGDLIEAYGTGKEVITRFTVDTITNNGIFYTDSNGREQIQRQLNKRSDYIYDTTEEPVSSNYYPVTSKIVIQDSQFRVAVLNDRAQGGSSLADGQIELMVHRRLQRDDGFGVGEPLNEIQYGRGLYVRGQHYLTFGDPKSSPAIEKDLAHKKLLAPLVFVADATSDDFNTLEKVQNLINFKGLTRSLDKNVQILTLEPWKDSYLLRLEHVMEKDEDDSLSVAATVDLTDLFTPFKIKEIRETTLGANINLETAIETSKIVLNPMQIRTFILTTDKNNEGGKELSDGTEHDGDNNNNNNVNGGSTKVTITSISIVLVTFFSNIF